MSNPIKPVMEHKASEMRDKRFSIMVIPYFGGQFRILITKERFGDVVAQL